VSDKLPFSGPRKGRNPKIDASVLEYFKDYKITRGSLNVKSKKCARNSNIPLKRGTLKWVNLLSIYVGPQKSTEYGGKVGDSANNRKAEVVEMVRQQFLDLVTWLGNMIAVLSCYLPLYHCQWNLKEVIWGFVKGYIAERNSTLQMLQ
jgi:hypothetical protein